MAGIVGRELSAEGETRTLICCNESLFVLFQLLLQHNGGMERGLGDRVELEIV